MDELTAIAQQSFLFRAESPTEGAQASTDAVRRFALRTLRDSGRLPKFEALAQASGTSEATLRRRLAEEGTTYREIRESCRRELGLQLLRRPGLSIEEISARLDYCDADAFRRAFHGWFGAPPSRFRRTALVRTD
jgi:AraC-like DNA-binding protein